MRLLCEECRLYHPQCQSYRNVHTPTRLINLTGTALKLVENVQNVSYIALSYCWGGNPGKWLTTTKASLEAHKISIPMTALPATLGDAISVTWPLGLRYIWIDALCIVQDDLTDWLNESKRMGDIYYNAYVVFAANVDVTCERHLFSAQFFADSSYQRELQLPGSQRVFVRPSSLGIHTGKLATIALPQGSRGWTLQESMMARPLLNFTRCEILWKCNYKEWCECFGDRPDTERDGFTHDWNLAKQFYYGIDTRERWPDTEKFYNMWHSIVTQYTQRKLARDSDRLVAISGIAQVVSKAIARSRGLKQKYLAGIWEGRCP